MFGRTGAHATSHVLLSFSHVLLKADFVTKIQIERHHTNWWIYFHVNINVVLIHCMFSVYRLQATNPQRSLAALGLMLTCMYAGMYQNMLLCIKTLTHIRHFCLRLLLLDIWTKIVALFHIIIYNFMSLFIVLINGSIFVWTILNKGQKYDAPYTSIKKTTLFLLDHEEKELTSLYSTTLLWASPLLKACCRTPLCAIITKIYSDFFFFFFFFLIILTSTSVYLALKTFW